jgi:hypothetical protein
VVSDRIDANDVVDHDIDDAEPEVLHAPLTKEDAVALANDTPDLGVLQDALDRVCDRGFKPDAQVPILCRVVVDFPKVFGPAAGWKPNLRAEDRPGTRHDLFSRDHLHLALFDLFVPALGFISPEAVPLILGNVRSVAFDAEDDVASDREAFVCRKRESGVENLGTRHQETFYEPSGSEPLLRSS